MIKKFFLIVISFTFAIQLTNSANALEGLAKFPPKKGATVLLEIAATPEERTKGLMNRPSLAPNRGMVFIFRPPQKVTFWMKDTLISLDMIFINKGKIVKIVKGAIPNQTDVVYPSDEDVTEAIEVNSGFSETHMIKVNDKVIFENIAQIDYSSKSKLMIVAK